jgi:hypothetical protein
LTAITPGLHKAPRPGPADTSASAPRQSPGAMPANGGNGNGVPARMAQAIALIGVLRQKFPAVFSSPPAPLAIGAGKELIELFRGEVPSRVVRIALRRWTGTPPYLAAIAAGELRLNLDGTPAGEPLPREARPCGRAARGVAGVRGGGHDRDVAAMTAPLGHQAAGASAA